MALIDKSKTTSQTFKDISLSFVRHPVTDDIGVFVNEDAIKRSVTNLVRTRVGERFYAPLLGSVLEESLFENQDPETALTIEDDIQLLLENYEPRIANIDVMVTYPEDTNELLVRIGYDVIGIGIR